MVLSIVEINEECILHFIFLVNKFLVLAESLKILRDMHPLFLERPCYLLKKSSKTQSSHDFLILKIFHFKTLQIFINDHRI